MRRFTVMIWLLLLSDALVCGQSRGVWLQGEWDGTGYQTNDGSTWDMKLSIKRKGYIVEYPSLGCTGRWTLVSIKGVRARFRERIIKGADKCAPTGNVVLERLNSRQIGYWYSYSGSREFVASAILNRRKSGGVPLGVNSSP